MYVYVYIHIYGYRGERAAGWKHKMVKSLAEKGEPWRSERKGDYIDSSPWLLSLLLLVWAIALTAFK